MSNIICFFIGYILGGLVGCFIYSVIVIASRSGRDE